MARVIQRKGEKSRQRRVSKAVNRPTGRLTYKPVSKLSEVALSRYAAGLPLNILQLEVVVGMSRATLYRMGNSGPPFLQVARGTKGRTRLYYPKDVEPWLRKYTRNATNQQEHRAGQPIRGQST